MNKVELVDGGWQMEVSVNGVMELRKCYMDMTIGKLRPELKAREFVEESVDGTLFILIGY